VEIRDIKTFLPHVGRRKQLVVKVETDEGIVGWGESGLSSREMAVAAAVQHFREFLIGKDPLQTGALWQQMYRSQYFAQSRSAPDLDGRRSPANGRGVRASGRARRTGARFIRHRIRAPV